MRRQDQQVAAAAIAEDGRWLGRLHDELRALLAPVFAQARSRLTAFAYIGALLAEPGDRRSCWQLAEQAGHTTPRRMQVLLAEHAWDWKAALAALQRLILACLGDPGAIVVLDETAELKKGTATVGVARQHAGITGQVENCQTIVFMAYVTSRAHALFDFRLYLPKQWCRDNKRRERAHVPDETAFATKPALGTAMLTIAASAAVPFAWVSADEVYGRSSKLREACEDKKGYVFAVPVNFTITRREEMVAGGGMRAAGQGAGRPGPASGPHLALLPPPHCLVHVRQALLAIAAARPAPPAADRPPAGNGQPAAWRDTGKLPASEAVPYAGAASQDDGLEAAIERLENSRVSSHVRAAADGLLALGYTLRLPETNVPGKRPENYLRIMDPMYTAHGIGYLTPSMFSFSRMSDRDRLASLPGAMLASSTVNFSHVDSAQPGLNAAKLLMEAAEAGANSDASSPPDKEQMQQWAAQGLFTHCQRCGYPFGALIRQQFCNVKQACDRRLREPGYRVPKGRTQDLTIRNSTIAKHPELGPPGDA